MSGRICSLLSRVHTCWPAFLSAAPPGALCITAAGLYGGRSRILLQARPLRRLTATLADGSGAALFAADARALVEDGLHELSFTPRIAGAARGCSSAQGCSGAGLQ